MQNVLPVNCIVMPVTSLSRVFDLRPQELLKQKKGRGYSNDLSISWLCNSFLFRVIIFFVRLFVHCPFT